MATLKQQKAMAHIIEGDSVGKAMRKAGYAEATARNPDHLTKSKAFTELLDNVGVTDHKLAERMNEGLDATRAVVMGGKDDSFVDIQPDFAVRHKYLETGLKIKGYQNDKQTDNSINVIIPIYGGLSGRPEDAQIRGYDSDQKGLPA